MNNNPNKEISAIRREMARKSLKFFATIYFKHYTNLPFAQFQLELFDYLQEITFKGNKRFALAAPRGVAKSSIISLIYVLWCICYSYARCIVLCSSTQELSEKLLSHIKDEISGNPDLMNDFPDVCELPNRRWRNDEIITKNEIDVLITSVSAKIRGVRHKSDRPGLIILDDVENHESVRTAEGREKLLEWFTKVILNLGNEKTNFIIAGTILHFDSLLSKLIIGEEFAGWDMRIYKSIERFPDRNDLWDQWAQIYRNKQLFEGKTGPDAAEIYFKNNEKIMLNGSRVLWEAKENFHDLMLIREQRGEAAFLSEKMNEPKAFESISSKEIDIWDKTGISSEDLIKSIPKKMGTGSCDPAVSLKPGSDYSAIVTGVWDITNLVLYVFDADSGRFGLDDLVKRIGMQHQIRHFTKFIYEANAAQAWLGNEIKKQFPLIPLQPITNTEPKEVRIMRLTLLIKQGKVKLSGRLTELIRQIVQYPYCAHDDLIDALSMLIEGGNIFAGQMDVERMQSLFAKIQNPKSQNPKKIIMYGGLSFNDPTGLLSAD